MRDDDFQARLDAYEARLRAALLRVVTEDELREEAERRKELIARWAPPQAAS